MATTGLIAMEMMGGGRMDACTVLRVKAIGCERKKRVWDDS